MVSLGFFFLGALRESPGSDCLDSGMIAGIRSSNWVDALRQHVLGALVCC